MITMPVHDANFKFVLLRVNGNAKPVFVVKLHAVRTAKTVVHKLTLKPCAVRKGGGGLNLNYS